MYFEWTITIPAGTTEAHPVEQILRVSKGVLTDSAIYFPEGCCNTAWCRLFRDQDQIIPLNRGEWAKGNGGEVHMERYYRLMEGRTRFTFVGCSPQAGEAHTVLVRISIVPEFVASIDPLIQVFQKFMAWLGAT